MNSQTSPQRKNGRPARNPDKESEPIEGLIHQLICLVDKQNAVLVGRNGSVPEEVILDRTVDAVRYLLIRMPSATAAHASLSPRGTRNRSVGCRRSSDQSHCRHFEY